MRPHVPSLHQPDAGIELPLPADMQRVLYRERAKIRRDSRRPQRRSANMPMPPTQQRRPRSALGDREVPQSQVLSIRSSDKTRERQAQTKREGETQIKRKEKAQTKREGAQTKREEKAQIKREGEAPADPGTAFRRYQS